MSKNTNWKHATLDAVPADLSREIDVFEGQMELRKAGRLDEKVFAETRLRRGVYGQRYDNGQRHDGVQSQTILFPVDAVKGPDTVWDAPGMQRIKIPFGDLTPDQLDVLAEMADEYSEGVLHVTTRQDIQLHYVHIEDTPDLMRRLGAVGITTLEACGNSVRNVTACPIAGVCRGEVFDVSPYANALTEFLLGHDDVQDFGRKFKIAFSGCEQEACGLAKMHDLGLLANTRTIEGETRRGFRIYVGGGLGTVPHQAKELYEFAPEEGILPITQAIARIFARLGEKRNRNRARIKFLVAGLGIDAFRELVEEELETLPADPRWTAYLDDLPHYQETPLKPTANLSGQVESPAFLAWLQNNVYQQRQAGYATATVSLPLGDFTVEQAYILADIARKYVGEHIRATVEQNLVLRWVSEADLPALYEDLAAIGLHEPNANSIVDITACPGTDTCKLGIASSRGLAGELRTRLIEQRADLPEAVKDLRIKISGCFNSCGQHHLADIGFFGNSRRRNNRTVPHFQVVLGGKWRENGGAYGLAVGAVPSKAIPNVLDRITDRYVSERQAPENFQDWVVRLGKPEIRKMLQPFTTVPPFEAQPEFYSDWGDPRSFSMGDLGIGECAGEVISLFSFEIAKAEGLHFDALIALDEGQYDLADERAYKAMLLAARALVRNQFLDVGDDPDDIVREFRARYYNTELFFDRFARGKFAHYLFDRLENAPANPDEDHAHRLIGEAQLFIDAAHACDARLAAAAQLELT